MLMTTKIIMIMTLRIVVGGDHDGNGRSDDDDQ